MLARQTLDIDLGTYEYRITECVETGDLAPPLGHDGCLLTFGISLSRTEMEARIRQILGRENTDFVSVRVLIPDTILQPQCSVHLEAILAVLDAWGIDRKLVTLSFAYG